MSAKEIIKAFPTPVKGGILSTIDKEACEKAVAQILKGGENVLRELVDLLIEPGKGNDVQARHTLHATAIRVGGPTKTKQRKAFAKNLAGTLSGDRNKAVKGFILRQLQICAGPEQGSAIAHFLTDPDEHLYEYSAQALEAIGSDTTDHFRKAYPKAKGAPRLTILQGLGVLRDKKSIEVFRAAAKEKDLEIRLAGLWGLMRIASAEDAKLVLATSAKEMGWGRIKSTGYCLQFAEALVDEGKKKEAANIYNDLKKNRTSDNEAHVREACERGLTKLG
ncbi:MAG: HEAT repeat domain-containing protein [Opitutales bacterium]